MEGEAKRLQLTLSDLAAKSLKIYIAQTKNSMLSQSQVTELAKSLLDELLHKSNCAQPAHPKGWGMLRTAASVSWNSEIMESSLTGSHDLNRHHSA
jgi:hypothetical protein